MECLIHKPKVNTPRAGLHLDFLTHLLVYAIFNFVYYMACLVSSPLLAMHCVPLSKVHNLVPEKAPGALLAPAAIAMFTHETSQGLCTALSLISPRHTLCSHQCLLVDLWCICLSHHDQIPCLSPFNSAVSLYVFLVAFSDFTYPLPNLPSHMSKVWRYKINTTFINKFFPWYFMVLLHLHF